jgi:hypothetical protein
MKIISRYFAFVTSSILIFSCQEKKTEVTPSIIIPENYISGNFATNATTEIQVTKQLKSLVDEIKKARVVGVTVSGAKLSELYNLGTPSVKSITSIYYSPVVEKWLPEIEKASGKIYTPSATITGDGGTYDGENGSTYLFDETGIEPEQIVEKGLFAAAFYKHLLSIISAGLDTSDVDKMIAIWGSTPNFSATNTAAKTSTPDANTALYAARRDKLDGNGFYTNTKNAFIKLKEALKKGENYNKERDEAVVVIKQNWEKAIGATVINYCYDGISKITNASKNSSDNAKALHSLSEAAGFIFGWKEISQTDKIITDSQIDELLNELGAPNNKESTYYEYVTNSATSAEKLNKIVIKLQSIYGFSDAQLADFKKNWINEQGR